MDESTQNASSPPGHSSADYMKFRTPEKKPRFQKLRKLLIRLNIAVLTLVLLGALGFFVYKKLTTKPAPKTTAPAVTAPVQQPKPITTETKHYDSPIFDMGIDYPGDWTVQESPNKLTIRSQTMQLRNVSDKDIDGQIVFTVEQPGQPLPAFDTGNAMAVRDSKKVSYTRPTSVQRGETYLSFLQYPATTAPNGLDGIYVTGDFGYLKDQAIPKVDVAKANPLITITFARCNDSRCGSSTPLTLAVSTWDDGDLAVPLETMIRSITIN